MVPQCYCRIWGWIPPNHHFQWLCRTDISQQALHCLFRYFMEICESRPTISRCVYICGFISRCGVSHNALKVFTQNICRTVCRSFFAFSCQLHDSQLSTSTWADFRKGCIAAWSTHFSVRCYTRAPLYEPSWRQHRHQHHNVVLYTFCVAFSF